MGAKDVDAAVARLNSGDRSATTQLWFAIQNMLTAAANVSKACWGQSGSLAKERKLLRKSIGISNKSPLRKTGMRNNFEHYDERLDMWWEKSKQHNHADMNIGAIGGLAAIDSFRELDPSTMEVIFWGRRYDLRGLVAEAERLLPVAEAEAAKPHWQP
ncbi:MAG: hypothetical protein H0W90_02185 [Actinobacteria bacterium]|nr:hypothetical protein [Actinomycetota bacterium]